MPPQRPYDQQKQHQQHGQDAGNEQIEDRERLAHVELLSHDAVENERHGRHEQKTQAAGGGHQTQTELLRIPRPCQGRQEQGSQGHDGHAGGAGQRREHRAGEEPNHGQTTRQPAEQALDEVHQTLRRAGLCEQISAVREQGQDHQQRRIDDPVDLDGNDRQIDIRGEKPEHGRRHQHGEQRRPDDGGDHDADDADPDHTGLNTCRR